MTLGDNTVSENTRSYSVHASSSASLDRLIDLSLPPPLMYTTCNSCYPPGMLEGTAGKPVGIRLPFVAEL